MAEHCIAVSTESCTIPAALARALRRMRLLAVHPSVLEARYAYSR